MRGTRTGPVYQCEEIEDVESGWFKSVYVLS